ILVEIKKANFDILDHLRNETLDLETSDEEGSGFDEGDDPPNRAPMQGMTSTHPPANVKGKFIMVKPDSREGDHLLLFPEHLLLGRGLSFSITLSILLFS
ncbi:hypothetical protein C1H46_004217, partial [Malus baccata]